MSVKELGFQQTALGDLTLRRRVEPLLHGQEVFEVYRVEILIVVWQQSHAVKFAILNKHTTFLITDNRWLNDGKCSHILLQKSHRVYHTFIINVMVQIWCELGLFFQETQRGMQLKLFHEFP